MRILQVGNWAGGGGGIQQYIHDSSVAMSTAGHTVIIASDGPGLGFHQHEAWREYPITGLAYSGKASNPEAVRRLQEILHREKPDVAYVHNILHPKVATELVNSLPTVFIHYTHDLYCPAGSKLLQRSGRICPYPAGAICFIQAFLERCQSRRPNVLVQNYLRMQRAQLWARHVNRIIVSSIDMKERLLVEGFKADQIVVLPLPVRIPKTIPSTPPTSQPPFVLFTGRLTPHKGLRYLIHAMRLSRLPYRLVVAGEGYEAPKIRALAQRMGVASRVDFLGWISREKVASLYDACAVAVVTSIWPEPFGLVGPEAMAHAKPVVAFNVGGIPDWLEHGVTGYLVPSRDVRQLAERIEQLLAEPELAQRMGRAGREKAFQLWGMEKHLNQLVLLLEHAIQQRRERIPTSFNEKGRDGQTQPETHTH